jgi:predicted ATP-dependent endonuclease of OLD family
MTERIQIKNFAGISSFDIEIRKINILIGLQATGKSVVVKLLFFFKSFIREILSAGLNKQYKREFDKEIKRQFLLYFPQEGWGELPFEINYRLYDEGIDEFIAISGQSGESSKRSRVKLDIQYSDFYKKSLTKVRDYCKSIEEAVSQDNEARRMLFVFSEVRDILMNQVMESLTSEARFEQIFIPAGRSFFAHIGENIFSLLSENESIDPFLIEFGSYYERMKSRSTFRLEEIFDSNHSYQSLRKAIAELNQTILCGQYKRINQKDYIEMYDGRRVQLSNSSSGQQETLPITIILKNLPAIYNPDSYGHSIYLEEPEAHLFPAAQREVVNLIATVYNANPEKLQFFITTHSPYILTAFNNLIQADLVARNVSEEKLKDLETIVPSSRYLRHEDVSVYSLSREGCESIMSEETNLIDANVIDDISNDLAVEFDDILVAGLQ